MSMSYKGFSLWLMVSLIVGAGLGAYGVVEWKEREVASRVTDAVLLEQERQSELYEERDVLRQKLEFQRLQLELSGIAVDTRRNNFGLAQERLARFGEDLEKMSREVGAPASAAIEEILSRQQEIATDLEALDPRAEAKLHQLFGALQDALAD